MGRPRVSPTDLGHCSVHGDVVVNRHRAGTGQAGQPRITWRCLECHLAQETARSNGQPLDTPTTIGFCQAEGHVALTPTRCRRPYGHPADMHVDHAGQMWPARTEREMV